MSTVPSRPLVGKTPPLLMTASERLAAIARIIRQDRTFIIPNVATVEIIGDRDSRTSRELAIRIAHNPQYLGLALRHGLPGVTALRPAKSA
jgi:hypothetical protein